MSTTASVEATEQYSLPSPYAQEPALLEPPQAGTDALACADLMLREGQSLVVNLQVAALAAHCAYQFLVRRELTQMATYFTLEPPTTKSRRVTEANVRTLQHVKSSVTKGKQ